MLHARIVALSFVLPVAVGAPARAQPAGAQAEILFQNAQTLMAQGKFAAACASFEASQKLEPAAVTVANLADCREKNGELASAWGLYLQVERELRTADDAASVRLRTVMRTRADALAPRLSKLEIRVAETSSFTGLEILRDNDRVEPGAWNVALPIDGGTYRISARGPERREWTTTIRIAKERDSQVVEVPALVASGNDSSPAPTATPPPAPRTVDTGTAPAAPRRWSFVVGGAAVAVGVLALGVEWWGRSTYRDAERSSDRDEQYDLWQAANTRRRVAIGLGLGAAVGVGVAVVMRLRERERRETLQAGLHVTPVVTGNAAGFSLGGRF